MDTTPDTGITIDFTALDNSLNVQVNGVDLFVGGPAGAPNELEFQSLSTAGQTVRFANGDLYEIGSPPIWRLANTNGEPIFRLVINPDGTVELYGVRSNDGPLEPLELFNGLTVNTAAIAAAWNDSGSNTVTVDQIVTGPTIATGSFSEDVPCFVSGTMIEIRDGAVPVENLQVGDEVLTYDGDYALVRWIGMQEVAPAWLAANPKLRPVRIPANALGPGYPEQDLFVSRQHRVLVSSRVAERMFGVSEVLIPAHRLLPLSGVELVDAVESDLKYWHILFDGHKVIWSNGAPSESLFLGAEALKTLSPEGRRELMTLFPAMNDPSFAPVSARFIPQKGKKSTGW